ncbi:MAG: succinate CoA transferase [Acidobacteria bacterium]|nr:succinate CoA transferase [Acidobacteriota bacterium]
MGASTLTKLTAAEAAALIQNGHTVGFSGFTSAGAAKAVPLALAERAKAEHQAGREFRIGVMTGASTGPSLDGALAAADAISFRTPYQSEPALRALINDGKVQFFDMHLSAMAQEIRCGHLGTVHCAVVEACDITDGGGIVLTDSVGASPTFCRMAEKVIVELNRRHPPTLFGMHDIYEPADPPYRREIPVYSVSDRIGSPLISVSPSKIAGVVEVEMYDDPVEFTPSTPVTEQIGMNVAEFLAREVDRGRIPKRFLPLQAGVGNVSNSVMAAIGRHDDIRPFQMYTEVLQDSVLQLIMQGRITFASACALTLSRRMQDVLYGNPDFFRPRIVLRPQEITNSAEIVRRLGIISINTALEADFFGNVNSTHVMGRNMMNGIGGSGDFTRNAFLSIFVCPSTAKKGVISSIVPLVSHQDHSEHSVQIIATEQGVADLRGLSPAERARRIIDTCAHPDYRDDLRAQLESMKGGHEPLSLESAFAFHHRFRETGTMRANARLHALTA